MMSLNKTKVFAVRVRDKYGQEVEDYINSKISNVTWIRDELPGVDLQWNKLRVMNMDIDEIISIANNTYLCFLTLHIYINILPQTTTTTKI